MVKFGKINSSYFPYNKNNYETYLMQSAAQKVEVLGIV